MAEISARQGLTPRQPACPKAAFTMVDLFAIGLTHALLAFAALRLVMRADLDADPAPGEPDSPHD